MGTSRCRCRAEAGADTPGTGMSLVSEMLSHDLPRQHMCAWLQVDHHAGGVLRRGVPAYPETLGT